MVSRPVGGDPRPAPPPDAQGEEDGGDVRAARAASAEDVRTPCGALLAMALRALRALRVAPAAAPQDDIIRWMTRAVR